MTITEPLTKRLVIAEAEGIVEAMQMTDQLADLVGCPPRVKLLLTLAAEEACTNALEHGATKALPQFEIRWTVSPVNYIMVVRQQQGQFVVPKAEECIRGRRGRGLQLISEIMDHVAVKNTKDVVELVMSKRIGASATSN